MDLTVQKASGARVFLDPAGAQGPQARARLRITLDGYSGAPMVLGGIITGFGFWDRRRITLDVSSGARRGAVAIA